MIPTNQEIRFDKGYFAVALARLYSKKATGKVVVRNRGEESAVYLRHGTPVMVRFSKPLDTLGRVLLTLGAIDDSAYNRSLQVMASTGKRQGEVLLEMGALDSQTLEKGLVVQQRRKLARLTKLKSCEVEFLNGEVCPDSFPVDPTVLIVNGIRECMAEQEVDRIIEPWLKVPYRFADDFNPPVQGLDHDENRILSIFEKSLALEEALSKVKLSRFQVCTLMMGLIMCGKLVKARGRQAGAVAEQKERVHPHFDELDELRSRINEKLKAAHEGDLFKILDLDESAGDKEISAAFFKLAKDFHPDRLSTFAPKMVLEQARKVFVAITQAKEILSDHEKRREYIRQLSEGKSDSKQVERSKAERALFLEAEGDVAFKRRDWNTAALKFKAASAVEPSAKRFARLAWCTWAQGRATKRVAAMAEAMELLDKALELDKGFPDTYKFVGRLLKMDGRKNEAAAWFKRAYELSPNDPEIASEVRLADMRSKKGDGIERKKSLWGLKR
ncbi:MAG: DnaJ domain-containing protein [Deltaproteobacteria bacterium]|nr:DnaJ domain-containing protein [Deltaproteobacteria bacterium]